MSYYDSGDSSYYNSNSGFRYGEPSKSSSYSSSSSSSNYSYSSDLTSSNGFIGGIFGYTKDEEQKKLLFDKKIEPEAGIKKLTAVCLPIGSGKKVTENSITIPFSLDTEASALTNCAKPPNILCLQYNAFLGIKKLIFENLRVYFTEMLSVLIAI